MAAQQPEQAKEEKKACCCGQKPLVMMITLAVVGLAIGALVTYAAVGGQQKVVTVNGTCTPVPCTATTDVNALKSKVTNYIETNLLGTAGLTLTITDAKSMGELYNVSFDIIQNSTVAGNGMVLASSNDLVIPNMILDMNKPLPTQETPLPADVPKSEKPVLDLFVWAFCPGGVSGEDRLKPVYDLLKNKADFNVLFIGPVTESKEVAAASCFAGQGLSQDEAIKACCVEYTKNGKTVYGCGLHHANEAWESGRQACILNRYGKDKLWQYMMGIDANCYPLSQDTAMLDACWKGIARNLSIDAAAIETCSSSTEALDILQADANLAAQRGVQSSPTFMVNGVEVSVGTSDSIKQSLCSAFNTAPGECQQVVSSPSETVSGGCG